MKKLLIITSVILVLPACSNKKGKTGTDDKKIVLRPDTINTVKLSDTLLIAESTCRGCEYEASTSFEIQDSLDIIKIYDIITKDNNPGNVEGGSVSKTLLLLPQKTGTTTFKLYKFWSPETRSEDSAHFSSYTIEVK